MGMDVRAFADLDALSRGALEELLRVMREAIEARGRFLVALGSPALKDTQKWVMAVEAPAKRARRLT